MEFGRFSFVGNRIPLAIALVLLCGSELKVGAQQAPAASSSGSAVPALPAGQPISQIAAGATQVATGAAANSTTPNNSAASTAGPSNGAQSGVPAAFGAAANADLSATRLGTGDLLEVSVYNVPELSTKARVGSTGDVYLPLIDYVHVSDLTVEEAQALIQKRLEDGGFVRNAHVSIFLDESASQGVTIIGEVAKPGIYPDLGDRRLYDLISAAGGFTISAGRKVSIIRQHSETGTITVILPRNLADDLQDNVQIMPGDTITIPKAPIIYVVGDVGHPAGLLIDNGSLTVLQALALAGGPNHTAKIGGVRIIRKGPGGMAETRVPLKKMLEAKAPDITLQADDILFVPLSAARAAAGTGLNAAMTAAAGLAIVAVH
jgi:polysaccharide export outer membrane protein